MAGTKRYDTFKRDSLLLDFMKNHKGEENLVSAKQISDFFVENGYSVKNKHSLRNNKQNYV